MAGDDLVTSALERFLRLSGLVGRVGASVAASRLAELALPAASRDRRRRANLVANAGRIVETLGKLKGVTMKLGQMMSLHEGMLPPEAAEVLRSLQKEAPRVPAEVMREEVRGSLKEFDRLFESLAPDAFAAASIGQVHRGVLRDGRRVAVKIQYPLIRETVQADLKNLRTLLGALFGLFSDVDFEPLWRELRDRLLEELDYAHEADNMRRMGELYAGAPGIVIPAVVAEASTDRVLTMEYVAGLAADEACSAKREQTERDRWGATLFEFVMRGIFVHRLLHADPNLANFAFLPDGRVVVYDFGCVKRVPPAIARGYAGLTLAAIEGRKDSVPGVLAAMGISHEHGGPLERSVTDPYFDLLSLIYREDPAYHFGEDPEIYRKLMDLGLANWSLAADLRFPEDVVFVNRSLSGHFGNLNRFDAAGPWREIVLAAIGDGPDELPAEGRDDT